MTLVHYWPLDETSGSVAEDEVGDSSALVINDDNTITGGIFGNARIFGGGSYASGTRSHLRLWQGSTPGASLPQWTLSFWMKRPDPGSNVGYFPEAWNVGEYGEPTNDAPLVYSSFAQNFSRFTVELKDGDASIELEHEKAFADNEWHLIIIRCDGVECDLIVDGQTVDTEGPGIRLNIQGKENFSFFGGFQGDSYADYTVDDLAVLDAAISDEEVDDLWNDGAGETAAEVFPPPPPIEALISVPGPLSAPRALSIVDWTKTVPRTAQIYYYARLRSGFISLDLPISSWQATLQSGRSSYLQCVVPAAAVYIDQITAISNNAQLAIIRGALFSDGERRELEMATVPLQDLPYQRGSQRETITLSGYGQIAFDVLGIGDNPGLTRNLSGIQTISTQGGTRVRASVDWMLRPGRVAVADGIEFVVSYINYYVNRNQEIMEVGERPL